MEKFNTQEELFKHLKQNKAFYISQKKSAIKRGDTFTYALPQLSKNEVENKDMGVSSDEPTGKIRVKAIINASNILDSHMDVHIGNIWKKSLTENKYILHLESHEREFDAVISDSPDVTASVKSLSWKSIGYDYEGNTYALIFDSYISSSRNEKMFNQYRNGWVKQHSVGMQYVTLYLCMNSDDRYYAEEKANWDKYINEVANKQDAIDRGWFWAVTEAKLIEGSAVVLASCPATPTQSVETVEAGKSTSTTIEPEESTQSVFLNPNLF